MHVANDLPLLLEIEVPGVRVDLFRVRRVRARGQGLLDVLAIAVLNPVRALLAVLAGQLLLERERAVGFGIEADSGGELCARAELRFRDVQLPHADDRIRGESRAGEQRSEEHTSELQSHSDLVCRLLLEKKKTNTSRFSVQQCDFDLC